MCMCLYTYILALSKTDEYLPVYVISKYSSPRKGSRAPWKKDRSKNDGNMSERHNSPSRGSY